MSDTGFEANLSLQLTLYTAVTTGKGPKKTIAKKDAQLKTKTLIFTFMKDEDSYVDLLNQILGKFTLDKKYKATSCNLFPIKVHIPPQKYSVLFLLFFSTHSPFISLFSESKMPPILKMQENTLNW